MNTKFVVTTSAAIWSLAFVGTASAQTTQKDEATESSSSSHTPLAPVSQSVELTVGTGYSQGFGDVGSGRPSLSDVGTAGGAVQVGLGYRFAPQLSLGVYGAGSKFGRSDSMDSSATIYSTAVGAEAAWHFVPSSSEFDPWVSFGAGWRAYWISQDQGTTAQHGLQLARVQFGVDYRVAQSVAISPVIGADASILLTESTPQSGGFRNISQPNVNTFLFVGLQGRFDIPTGAKEGPRQTAQR